MKNIFGAQIWAKGSTLVLKLGFFGSLVFLQIAYNDNLQQCETRFFTIFSSLVC